jgi:hypothetical protein
MAKAMAEYPTNVSHAGATRAHYTRATQGARVCGVRAANVRGQTLGETMTTITPIPTRYQGYLFRSRLEARWAVYFDAVGLRWVYEPEGFDLGNGLAYLPDFWLPQVKHWCECKPEEFSAVEIVKATRLVEGSQFPLVMLVAPPSPHSYWSIRPGETDFIDVIVDARYVRQNRFFTDTGCDGDFEDLTYIPEVVYACQCARSARFESC